LVIAVSCNENDNSTSLDPKSNEAIEIFARAKSDAVIKGKITSEQSSITDTTFIGLLTSNPDSALQYAKNVRNMVEAGELRSWPPIQKTTLPDSFITEQSQIAYASMRFGMSEKEVKKLPKKETEYFQTIGDHRYLLTPVYNNQGKLYMVTIKGYSKMATYLETEVNEEIKNLVEVISEKYGQPEYISSLPNVLELDPGYLRWMRKWNIGNKTIKIGAGEESSSSEYYSVCWIYDQKMFDEVQKQDEEKSTSIKVADANKF